MYTILIKDDNTMIATNKERIMQRSKLVDNLHFLTKPTYKGYNLSEFTLTMEYVLPKTRKYRTETLVLSKELYKEHLQYTLPFDTMLTTEAGEIEIMLTFTKVEMDANGKIIQRVRKIEESTVEIIPLSAWCDIIPDEALSALDQRILVQDAQIRANEEMLDYIYMNKADNIEYNEEENSLQLTSNGETIGKKVILNDECDEDGVPVVDFSNMSGDDSGNIPDEESNVILF